MAEPEFSKIHHQKNTNCTINISSKQKQKEWKIIFNEATMRSPSQITAINLKYNAKAKFSNLSK